MLTDRRVELQGFQWDQHPASLCADGTVLMQMGPDSIPAPKVTLCSHKGCPSPAPQAWKKLCSESAGNQSRVRQEECLALPSPSAGGDGRRTELLHKQLAIQPV